MYTHCIQVSTVCQIRRIVGSRQARRNINNDWNVAAPQINIYSSLGSKQKTNKILLKERKHETDSLTCVFVFLIGSYNKYVHFLWQEFWCQSVFMNVSAEDLCSWISFEIHFSSFSQFLFFFFQLKNHKQGWKWGSFTTSRMGCLRDTLFTGSTSSHAVITSQSSATVSGLSITSHSLFHLSPTSPSSFK